MAVGDRFGECATLRLTGATPPQMLLGVGEEAAVVTCAGVVPTVGVTAATVALTWAESATGRPPRPSSCRIGRSARSPPCLVTVFSAVLASAAVLLRRRHVELAGPRA
ncbi:hypothetical protein ACFYO0_34610 [Streptomyces sp. NPDC006365]|uniref:hypothetical protein n=1 Tax=Streptomyces sp. NPDC006365 TaxID=3364744 RepID=UPI0036AB970C